MLHIFAGDRPSFDLAVIKDPNSSRGKKSTRREMAGNDSGTMTNGRQASSDVCFVLDFESKFMKNKYGL
jgi:hypothetical protein